MATQTPMVAVVSGASRGAGKGIALALGDTGATVYCLGRTRRERSPPDRRRAGIDRRHRRRGDGARRPRHRRRHRLHRRGAGRRGVRAGGARPRRTRRAGQRRVGRPRRVPLGRRVDGVDGAAVLGTRRRDVGVDDGRRTARLPAGQRPRRPPDGRRASAASSPASPTSCSATPRCPKKGHMPGMLFPVVAHDCINRLMYCLSEELKTTGIAVVTLMPGLHAHRAGRAGDDHREDAEDDALRPERERLLHRPRRGAPWPPTRRSPSKSGRIHYVADLAAEYGFTDADGTRHPRFDPFS